MLEEIINKNRKNFTTITSFLVVLEDYIQCLNYGKDWKGLSAAEIGKRYEAFRKRFGKRERYYSTYVQRHSQAGDLFVEKDNKYLIRPELIKDEFIEQLVLSRNQIISLIEEEIDNHSELIDRIDRLIESNNQHDMRLFISELFEGNGFRNFGQIFEILSFSILKVYFRSFGFLLNRFSTSFSNDGGMDFISGLGIYQVTATPTNIKIENDLSKLPGIQRVLVFTKCDGKTLEKLMNHSDVSEIISVDDLKKHFLDWLYQRDQIKKEYMKEIIKSIKEELIRER